MKYFTSVREKLPNSQRPRHLIHDFITTLTNFTLGLLPIVTEAQHFNLGQTTLNRRLKPRLSGHNQSQPLMPD